MAQQLRSPFENFPPLEQQPAAEPAPTSKARARSASLLSRVLAPLTARRVASADATCAVPTEGPWERLPGHLLEKVFDIFLEAAQEGDATARKDMFAAVGVCKTWRRIGFEHFFLRPWAPSSDILHPLQLLSLSGRAAAAGLMRCYMRRESTPKHGVGCARYTLWLGAHEEAGGSKFLLAALQTSRREILIYLDRHCTGRPIARLGCSLLQMRYRIEATPGCALPFVDALTRPDGPARRHSFGGILLPRLGSVDPAPGSAAVQLARLPPVLAEVQYFMRLKGFMRPRKMRVTLPHPLELAPFDMDEPAAMARLAPVCGTCPLPEPCAASSRTLKRSASGPVTAAGASLLARLRSSGAVMAAAHSMPAAGLDAAADAALEAAGLGPGALPPANPQRLPLGLRNKQPHWNDNLRCHCLNFHGRVKEASVKNFQLVCADAALAVALSQAAEPAPGCARPTPSRAARAVALQFGKVTADLFILDYNATVVTGLQAFCVALTNFDCKLMV